MQLGRVRRVLPSLPLPRAGLRRRQTLYLGQLLHEVPVESEGVRGPMGAGADGRHGVQNRTLGQAEVDATAAPRRPRDALLQSLESCDAMRLSHRSHHGGRNVLGALLRVQGAQITRCRKTERATVPHDAPARSDLRCCGIDRRRKRSRLHDWSRRRMSRAHEHSDMCARGQAL